MVPRTYHTKAELLTVIPRFLKDPDRGISVELFAELCGIDKSWIKKIFVDKSVPLSEYVQRRVSKAWDEWRAGEVAVMRNQDKTKFVQYRKTPRSQAVRGYGLQMVDGNIKLKIGIKNRADYPDSILGD